MERTWAEIGMIILFPLQMQNIKSFTSNDINIHSISLDDLYVMDKTKYKNMFSKNEIICKQLANRNGILIGLF